MYVDLCMSMYNIIYICIFEMTICPNLLSGPTEKLVDVFLLPVKDRHGFSDWKGGSNTTTSNKSKLEVAFHKKNK